MKIIDIIEADVTDIGTGFGGLEKKNPETKGEERFTSRGKIATDGVVSAYHTVRLPKTTGKEFRIMIAERISRSRNNITKGFNELSILDATPYTWVSFRRFIVDNVGDPTEMRIPFEVSPVDASDPAPAVEAVIRLLKKMISGITEKAVEDFRD